MNKKSKRTPGLETAHLFAGLRPVNPHAAGVDLGATEIVVPGAKHHHRGDGKHGRLLDSTF